MSRRDGLLSFGVLAHGPDSVGSVARRTLWSPTRGGESEILAAVSEKFREGKEQGFAHRPKARGKRLRLLLDRKLARFRGKAGAALFELLARALANEKAAPGLAQYLGRKSEPLPVVLLDRSRHLVEVEPRGGLIGVNRVALRASRLSIAACLVAVAIVHGLRAAARLRARERYVPEKEWARDVQNLLVLLVGIRGTEWEPDEVREEMKEILAPEDPLLAAFGRYAAKLKGSLSRIESARLDDRVFRDGALFDRLPQKEKRKVVLAGTLAWYGLLTLGILRLPRRFFARRNAYYETAWWIFRAKPGGRTLFKTALLRRGLSRLAHLRILSGAEYVWSSWNPILAVTCLRPLYRSAGGNRRPFLATMATFAYTALVIHPLWVTLTITGLAGALGLVWPAVYTHTRIASVDNLILHGIVIGFWIGIGLIVATSKLVRRLLVKSKS